MNKEEGKLLPCPVSKCSRCGQYFPDDPLHPGYPDVHKCIESRVAEPVEGAPALEKLIEAFAHEIHYGKSGQYTPLTQLDIDIIEAARQEAANRRPSTGQDERVAVLLSRLDAVCCILAIVDGPMPTKQELGMAYDELVSVRDDVAGIIRHLPAPSHSDVEPPWAYLRPFTCVDGFLRGNDGKIMIPRLTEQWGRYLVAALNGESK